MRLARSAAAEAINRPPARAAPDGVPLGSPAVRLVSLAAATAPAATRADLIANAAAAGFGAVGLRFDLDLPDATERRELRSRLDATGLVLLDAEVIRLGAYDDDLIRHVLDAAGELGARFVLTVSDDADLDGTVERFGRLCEDAAVSRPPRRAGVHAVHVRCRPRHRPRRGERRRARRRGVWWWTGCTWLVRGLGRPTSLGSPRVASPTSRCATPRPSRPRIVTWRRRPATSGSSPAMVRCPSVSSLPARALCR